MNESVRSPARRRYRGGPRRGLCDTRVTRQRTGPRLSACPAPRPATRGANCDWYYDSGVRPKDCLEGRPRGRRRGDSGDDPRDDAGDDRRDDLQDDPYDDPGDLSIDDSRDYLKDDPRDSLIDDTIDDLGVRLQDDLQDDRGDRPLDGPLDDLGNDLLDDLVDDLRNHGTNPRPFACPRNFPGLRHLGRGDSFGCDERLNE